MVCIAVFKRAKKRVSVSESMTSSKANEINIIFDWKQKLHIYYMIYLLIYIIYFTDYSLSWRTSSQHVLSTPHRENQALCAPCSQPQTHWHGFGYRCVLKVNVNHTRTIACKRAHTFICLRVCACNRVCIFLLFYARTYV